MVESFKYTLLGGSQLGEITSKVNASIEGLFDGWFSKQHLFSFNIKTINETLNLEPGKWDFYANDLQSWVAFKREGNTQTEILEKLFGVSFNHNNKYTSFTKALYQEFLDSIVVSIFSLTNTINLNNKTLSPIEFRKGSGAILAHITDGKITIEVAIGGKLLESLYDSTVKNKVSAVEIELMSRQNLISSSVAEIEVSAGAVKMTLRDLSKIEVGDVILLDKKLGSGFSVLSSNGSFLANSQLGKHVNNVAIQIIE